MVELQKAQCTGEMAKYKPPKLHLTLIIQILKRNEKDFYLKGMRQDLILVLGAAIYRRPIIPIIA